MAIKHEKNNFLTLTSSTAATSHQHTGNTAGFPAGLTGSAVFDINTVQVNTAASGVIQTPTPQPPLVSRCSKDGHQMHMECELDDGGLTGMCAVCGEIIKARRNPGGLAVLQLRRALEAVLAGEQEMLTEEFLILADQVEAEEAALQEARSLLRLAERVLLRGRVTA